jgi:hypothetical protein
MVVDIRCSAANGECHEAVIANDRTGLMVEQRAIDGARKATRCGDGTATGLPRQFQRSSCSGGRRALYRAWKFRAHLVRRRDPDVAR